MEKFFKLSKNGTNVKTEIIGGVTTFFAMAYIIFVNPDLLSSTGMDFQSVMVATCIASALGCFLTGLIANVPFAQAPGMGLNAFFSFTVAGAMGYTWQQALTIVLISGLLFLAITVSPLRKAIIVSIPADLKNAISTGIGLFIAFIGLNNAGIIHIFEGFTDMGDITHGSGLLAVIGILITGVLMAWNVKGAIFIGIVSATIIGLPLQVTKIPESFVIVPQINTIFQFDFGGLMSLGVLPLVTAIITFLIVDMFDTVGTLIGTASNAGMIDEDGNMRNGDKALIADAIATCAGACLGTSTVTTYVESTTGVSAGARTGLSSCVTGALFLVALVLAPVAGIVPSAATAPAMIIVGVLMMKGVSKINWNDIETAIPCFLTVAMMPFAYSIADGIGFGFISYAIIKLFRRKGKEVPVLIYILSALFIATYILTFLH